MVPGSKKPTDFLHHNKVFKVISKSDYRYNIKTLIAIGETFKTTQKWIRYVERVLEPYELG